MNITNELGLKIPLFQAPLECYPKTSGLVAKISECGALGNYGTEGQYIEEINDSLSDIKLRTDKPFAVTIDVTNGDDNIDLADKSSANVYLQGAYIALKLSQSEAKPLPKFNEIFTAVVPQKPAVIIFRNGLPDDKIILEAKRNGIMTMVITSNMLESIASNQSKIDAIILQGVEAAGSLSQFDNNISANFYSASTLLNHAVGNISKPLVIWGDCQTPANIVGALVNGASAVVLDTPFWTAQESSIPSSYRRRLAEHTEMTVTTSDVWNGYPSNILKNDLTKTLKDAKSKTLSAKKQQRLMLPIIRTSIEQDCEDYMPLWAGFCAKSSNKTVSELCDRFLVDLSSMIE